MACTSFTFPASPTSSTLRPKDIFKEHIRVRRFCSVNHPCHCINHIQVSQSKLQNNNRSIGISPFQSLSSMVPNLLRSFLFGPATSKHMKMQNSMHIMEKFGESTSDQGEEIKGANWMEGLVALGDLWSNIWEQKEVADEDNTHDEGENGGCGSGGEEGGCAESCGLEDNDGEMRYRSYDQESFSRFLVRVPWSDTKLFSKLAFLCNMACVIPEIKAEDLKIYGLQFVTSSLQKKAEVAVSLESSTMTEVLQAASEMARQETENDLLSLHHSLPCEWFVCDDSSTSTRCFVIQGMDSLASRQAYLFFEPTKFEETNVHVHRGTYEAAQQMYQQFMPDILEHLHRNGELAKLQFTGHCLGGSIALLVHMMLLTRKLVKPSTLLPVVTFGSPFVFCGGHKLLDQLGLDVNNHIHCVMMHRDVVPRAFSCNYPNHVATLLKRLNGSFQSLPCLIKNKTLYSPIGKLFILQPDERLSPPHPLLPMGSALSVLDNTQSGFSSDIFRAFLNSPHPLETLGDPTAYGSEGTILRDHDSNNYLKDINKILRKHTRMVVRKVRKQRNLLWPLLTSPSPHQSNNEDESGPKRETSY
ncbi:phospholipase A1 PLIP1, chloroplastic-like [Pyrus communis]|uniref:phospholipase A1 PLIP1, chloroplastic-like n=1 Tax=Pyrus communis TaxID=23211 RepID=UPI0035C07B14